MKCAYDLTFKVTPQNIRRECVENKLNEKNQYRSFGNEEKKNHWMNRWVLRRIER